MENERIDYIIDKHDAASGSMIQILLEIQKENHWLPREAINRISRRLKVPINQVMNIVTFYKAFRLAPEGNRTIHVCNGSSCHVRGSQNLIETLQDLTGIPPGQMDLEKKFSLKTSTCLGCCSAGPVLVVDEEVHAHMDPDKTRELIKRCL
jgi:NADH-quinone oxidoreductase subunit E